ncbi:leucine-rich repeat domain-containing protein, partial [Flammeovirga aprica]
MKIINNFYLIAMLFLLTNCTNYRDMTEQEIKEYLDNQYGDNVNYKTEKDGYISKVKFVDIPSLKDVPEKIRGFQRLEEIKIINCNITEIPKFITEFTELKTLWLEGCPIKELSPFITNCHKLSTLDLSSTEISKFPEGFGNLPITSLYLEGSKIQGFPEELYEFDSLTHLYLNPINELPSDISNFKNLKHLKVALKSFKYVDTIESIEILILNNSTGKHLPEGLGNLPSLKDLNLKYCKSLFKLPSSLGNLYFLSGLDLTGCSRLTGLPASLNKVPMRVLKIGECNNLRSVPKGLNVGSIWAENVTWKNMPVGIFDSKAHSLNVINHQITDITGIGRMTNLRKLDLTNGKIKRIPPDISKCTKLRLLLLEGNEIESTFGV